MPSFFDKFKGKTSHRKSPSQGGGEPTFSIQPHPAKTNDPADLQQPTAPGAGLRSDPVMGAHNAKGPYVPSPEVMKNVEQPKGREELRARAAELNK